MYRAADRAQSTLIAADKAFVSTAKGRYRTICGGGIALARPFCESITAPSRCEPPSATIRPGRWDL
jgi:hypothetical protein